MFAAGFMQQQIPESLIVIAGKGVYPLELASSARAQGVKRITAVAFPGETEKAVAKLVDEVKWIKLGQYSVMLDAMRAMGIPHAVMAGGISPTALFRVRPDKAFFDLLGRLKEKNAETIFGAVGEDLKKNGIELLPAHRFMEKSMPEPGLLTANAPTESQQRDIELGLHVAKTTSSLEIGQTVVIKEGTILAVEAFEGTDATILRAGELGGDGSVVVKVAKRGHDMRFDIPVVGERTLKTLKKAGASVIAVEARRTILLDRGNLIAQANRQGLCIIAIETKDSP
jgi:DUF1009 family protein